MLIIGMMGKIGVFFASMPEPILGGMYLVMFGIVAAVGISNLQVFFVIIWAPVIFCEQSYVDLEVKYQLSWIDLIDA